MGSSQHESVSSRRVLFGWVIHPRWEEGSYRPRKWLSCSNNQLHIFHPNHANHHATSYPSYDSQNVGILRQIRVTILSPEMSTLMNYEVIERWILGEKYIF